ncbi:AAA family ATPase [Pseudomonas canadensis]|uniref:AAA family ATPase n=1 Tax=Pseudomonas canadensis TaxID=915099 RepID=UPI0030D95C5F
MEQEPYFSPSELIPSLISRIRASLAKNSVGGFTYIIGNNGTGKSRALSEISLLLEKKNGGDTVACISSSIHDRFRFGTTGNVKYLGARNARNAVFLSAIERNLSYYVLQAMQIDRRLLKELISAAGMDISFAISEKSISELEKSSSELTRDGRRVQQKAADQGLLTGRSLAMLKRVAKGDGRFESLTPAQIPMLIGYLESNIDMSLRIQVRGDDYSDFGGLSTGEQNRLLIFAKIISVMEEGTVFLIDEPELSLHLHWQMDFHKTLKKLLSRLQRFHVVVATHSPILISEAVREDSNSSNIVAVLSHGGSRSLHKGASKESHALVSFRLHSFTDVASHEQLVLKQFHTSTFETREVSVEIADTVLSHVEGFTEKSDALAILEELGGAVGLSDQAKKQLEAAIQLVKRGLATSIKEQIAR